MKWKWKIVKKKLGIKVESSFDYLIGSFQFLETQYRAYLGKALLYRSLKEAKTTFTVYRQNPFSQMFEIIQVQENLLVAKSEENLIRLIYNYEVEVSKSTEKVTNSKD